MNEPDNLTLRILQEIRAEVREFRKETNERFARLEAAMSESRDDITIASSLAMRATGERIAWNTAIKQIKGLSARVARLESAKD